MQTQTPVPVVEGNHPSTQAFIANLVAQAPAKRGFLSPVVYLGVWLVGSLVYMLMVTSMLMDVRFDLALRLQDPFFIAMVALMFCGAVAFAYSALVSSLPAQKGRGGYFGIGATLSWIGLLVYGMVCDLPSLLSGQLFYHFDLRVFGTLLLSGSVPLLALWLIVSHLAPMKAGVVATAMSLASFMLAATVLRFFYVSLNNGVDCSFNLFFWILIPMLVSSGCGTASVLPLLRSWLPNFPSRR